MNPSLVRCLVVSGVSLWALVWAPVQGGAAPQVDSFPCGACFALVDDGPPVLVPLESTEVVLEVKPGLLEAQVIQTFVNRGESALEAVYRYPLPHDATITHFELHQGDRVIVSRVREKAAARAAYAEAKSGGRKTALLEREDPTLFSTAVANFLPGETIRAVIRFVQPVEMWSDGFEVRFPMVTGTKYFPADALPGGEGHSAAVPDRVASMWNAGHAYAFDIRVSGVPIAAVDSPSHSIVVESRDDGSRLIALAEEVTVPDRDFVLQVQTAAVGGVAPTWITQSTETGDYGLLAIFPPAQPPMSAGTVRRPRDILFLVDRSGSMSGARIENAKRGVQMCLERLRPEDRFQVVVFSTGHEFFAPEWTVARPAAVARAREWVGGLHVEGGTELQPALKDCLDFFEGGGSDEVLVVLTDGEVGNERSLVTLVERRLRNARVFAVGIGAAPNPYLIRKLAEAGRGQARFIAKDLLISREIEDLFTTLDAPLITDVRVGFLDATGGAVEHVAFPEALPEVFHARPVQTVVRFADGRPARVVIEGLEGGRAFRHEIPIAESPLRGDGLEKLFGMRWMDRLDDMLRRAVDEAERVRIRKEMLDTALLFQLVSEQTSRVAVETRREPDPVVAPQASQPAWPLVRVSVAQSRVADQPAAPDPDHPDVIVLSPFEVATESEGSYIATHTLAGARIRTNLDDVGSAVQVVTAEFLRDTGATTLEELAGYVAGPQERPDVARSGSETGMVDGLPLATIIDAAHVLRIVTRTGGPAWSNVEVRRPGAGVRSGMELRVGDDGHVAAGLTLAGDPTGDGSMPVLGAVRWSRLDGDASSVLCGATRDFDGLRLGVGGGWYDIAGYGSAMLVRAGARTRLGYGVVIETEAARHELRRDDPAQFRLGSQGARQAGLGFLNLDLLTAGTSRLVDTTALARAYGSVDSGGLRHQWGIATRWTRHVSDWSLPEEMASVADRRDVIEGGVTYQGRSADDVVIVGLGVDRAMHRDRGGHGDRRHTGRAWGEISGRISGAVDLFGSVASDEFVPWAPTGWYSLDGDVLRGVAAPVERRDSIQAGVRVRLWDERISGYVAWFEDHVSRHHYRDWTWEREHGGEGLVWVDGSTARAAVGTSIWPDYRRRGWIGGVDIHPTRALTATATWHVGTGDDGPYIGGDRRLSILSRYEVQSGWLRRAFIGLGLSHRDTLEFVDGARLSGGTQWDLMAGYRFGATRGRGVRVQLNLTDATDRRIRPTRFAPERGRRWVLTVAHGF